MNRSDVRVLVEAAPVLLAEVGAALEAFDETTDLQPLAELAVPRFADLAWIHLKLEDDAVLRAFATSDLRTLDADATRRAADTAVARVLAGGPPALVAVDDHPSAPDDACVAALRAAGQRSLVAAALVARGHVLGAITLASARWRFDEADLGVIADLARRIAVALDNRRLLRSEREARERAERARERTRRLQELTAQLSGALREADVASQVVVAGRGAIGAAAGFAWLLRDGQTLELAAHAGDWGSTQLANYRRVPLSAPLPVCEVVRTGKPLVFANVDAMLAAFPGALSRHVTPYHAWAVIPFVVHGCAIGAASFSFEEQHAFSSEDRELLTSMIGQASLALERCYLLADIELARQRERELYGLATQFSSARTVDDIARIVRSEVSRALDAHAGAAVFLDDDRGLTPASADPGLEAAARGDAALIAEAVRTGELVWCSSPDELAGRYPELAAARAETGAAAWGALPLTFEDRVLGGLALRCPAPRTLRPDERAFLKTAGQLAGQAFERARLYDELRRKDERLHTALFAGRAGTWTVDLRTMQSHRDASFGALFGLPSEVPVDADFSSVHPDDRAIASAALARTLRDGVPYEPEVRMQKLDGSYIWTRSFGRLLRDGDVPALLAGVTFDVDEAKRATLELERAYAIARDADRRKDEFLAMLGHELRNPLAPIRTALDLMDFKAIEGLQKEREVIGRQVEHLSRLIDDLLDVSRITRGKVQLARAVVDLATVLMHAIEMTSPLLEKQSHRLLLDVPRAGLWVDADATRLTQVFQNLLTNAAKYTPVGGEIAVTARATEHEIWVEIRDNGIGISPELLPRVFDLFTQGERRIDRSEGGLGIGLAIARNLCELHGGAITAASAGLDRGSTFTVRLPRARAADARVVVAPTAAAPRPAATKRVLIVDDNVDAAEMLGEFLSELGYEVATAHDGVAGLELATAFKPDVALLDIGLPLMDGYELARLLRAAPGLRHADAAPLRLIALTGYGQESDRARALAAGFDHHMVKPLAFDKLRQLIDDAGG